MLVSSMTAIQPVLADLVFRGSLPWWAVGLLIAVSIGLVVALYASENMRMHPVQRVAMGLFRGLALIAIVLLLKKPVLISEEEATRPRPIALLVDNSQSMKQQDPRTADADLARAGIALGALPPDHSLELNAEERSRIARDGGASPSRAQVVEGAFQNQQLKLREELAKKGPLQEYLFGSQVRGAGPDWEKELPATEARTAIMHSISQILKRDDNELPAAIVVATDGLENDREHRIPWQDVARECAKLGIPLHVYGVGSSGTRLLQLRSFESNPRDTLLLDSAVSATFRWIARGIPPGDKVELQVRLGGKLVAKRTLAVKEGDDVSETVTFVPKREKGDPPIGRAELEGSIHLVGAPENETDKIAFPVSVVESKVKVLVVENDPRWEFKFLMRALQREKVADAKFVLIHGDDKAVKLGGADNPFLPEFPKTRKELFAFDMLIIGDVPASYFTAQQQKWIADFVDQGGGLVMIAGRQHNPADYVNQPLGGILPVEFDAKPFPIDDNKPPAEYVPRLSDLGRHETLMSMADTPEENLKIWSKFPGWYWFYPVTKLKPAAQSLLEHPKETIEDPSPLSATGRRPMPLIARQFYGRGIVMFVGGDETWRWRFNEADKYFARFWGQVVYQLGLPHVLGGGKAQLTAEGDFLRGKPTRVYARLFTQDFRPLTVADNQRVMATLESPGPTEGEKTEEQVAFEPVPNQPGMFVATIARDKPGDYTLKLPSGSSEFATLPVRVTVPPDDEQAPGNLNEKLLRDLAGATEAAGGKFYREDDLKDLAADVKAKTVNLNPPPRKEVLLWTRWWVLAGVIGLLTVEWIVRKFSNLS